MGSCTQSHEISHRNQFMNIACRIAILCCTNRHAHSERVSPAVCIQHLIFVVRFVFVRVNPIAAKRRCPRMRLVKRRAKSGICLANGDRCDHCHKLLTEHHLSTFSALVVAITLICLTYTLCIACRQDVHWLHYIVHKWNMWALPLHAHERLRKALLNRYHQSRIMSEHKPNM